MKIGKDKNYKVGQIRFNFINKHYGHIKAIIINNNKTKITSVFISTSPTSENEDNIEMTGKFILNGKENTLSKELGHMTQKHILIFF